MPPAAKIRQALKSAARLPVRVSLGPGRGSGRSSFSPTPGEVPLVFLRMQIIGCRDLLAKDRNGYSDPFVVASVLSTRHHTPVAKRTINPIYPSKDATFDFPIYLSLADKLGVLELVVWDKDVLTKDYLGEVSLALEDWFTDDNGNPRPYAFDDPLNTPFSLNVVSTRANTHATGSIQIRLGFVSPPNRKNDLEFVEIFSELVKRTRPSLVSAPPTEGVGTIRSHQNGPEFEDDGGLSSDEGSDDEDFVDASEEPAATPTIPSTLSGIYDAPLSYATKPSDEPAHDHLTTPTVEVQPPSSPLTPVAPSPLGGKTPTASTKTSSSFIPRVKFPRKLTGLSTTSSASSPLPTPDSGVTTPSTSPSASAFSGDSRTATAEKRSKFRRSWTPGTGSSGSSGSDRSATKGGAEYRFGGGNDIVGIVMVEIQRAEDLPRLRNMTRTGWDMDPFVVMSFGKKVFRTRVIRHSLNPVWDEKLLFHVRRYETTFKIQLAILDWDKLSSNDHIGDASFDLKELLDNAPQPDPVTGLYSADEGGDRPMTEYTLTLSTAKEMPWESKHNPIIKFRAKYQPYDALRQRFWRQYLKQYDTDDTGTLSHLEITSMLDSLGSTLTRSTVSSFFTRYGKKPHEEELTLEEAIQCLETELGRPDSEKRRLDADDNLPESSVSATPILMVSDRDGNELSLDKLDFSGPASLHGEQEVEGGQFQKAEAPPGFETEPMQLPLSQVAAIVTPSESSDDAEEEVSSGSRSPDTAGPGQNPTGSKKMRFRKVTPGGTKRKSKKAKRNENTNDAVERVINVKNCPLCHRPRMNSKAEMDIITHLAVCASQDWNKVDQIVVANFVTASQAQRKWYTRIISKVSSGDYKLGANSANIIVQNRMTGQLEEEKMQVYVRLGIRLLYKGMNSRMEGGRARRLLKSLSIKQGVKYDSPESARDIPIFIEFHGLSVDEILDPIDSFQNFNQFFYRKLKPSARPVERLDDPYRLVSVADCRLMTFETVSEATRLWIKGRDFTVSRLLGDNYKNEVDKYNGGALAIFRLAPQDYHRFHSPVDGSIGPMTYIAGEYYTVNPQAIRTALDVYGDNVRKIVPIDSPQFGRVMAVCVGAMMVGSIETTVEVGQQVKRGQEFGYFAFGGSTIVLLFEKGVLEWDEDLLINGRAALETLVRVGMGIGNGRRRAIS